MFLDPILLYATARVRETSEVALVFNVYVERKILNRWSNIDRNKKEPEESLFCSLALLK